MPWLTGAALARRLAEPTDLEWQSNATLRESLGRLSRAVRVAIVLDRRIDAVTFTSANTVRAFVEIYGAEQSTDLLSGTGVETIGPGAADAAGRAGIRVDVPAEGATIAALVDGLISYFTPFLA